MVTSASRAVEGLAPRGRAETVHIVAWRASQERNDGGGKRLRAFVAAFEKQDISLKVSLIGPSAESGDGLPNTLQRVKRDFLPMPLRRRFSRELPSDSEYGLRVSLVPASNQWAVSGEAGGWIDFPDLWSAYARRHSQSVGGPAAATSRLQAELWRRRETKESRKAGKVIVASVADRSVDNRSVWLPTPIISRHDLQSRGQRAWKGPIVAGFLANFHYPPNRDAYMTLIRDWIPVLTRRGVKVVVAGWGSENLPKSSQAELLGPIDSLEGFYSTIDFAVSPVMLGGGMKVKVVEALSWGVPVVASNHSFDGLPLGVMNSVTPWDVYKNDESWSPVLPFEDRATMDALDSFTTDHFEQVVRTLFESSAGTGGRL